MGGTGLEPVTSDIAVGQGGKSNQSWPLLRVGPAIAPSLYVPSPAGDSEPAEQHNRTGSEPEQQESNLCYRHGDLSRERDRINKSTLVI